MWQTLLFLILTGILENPQYSRPYLEYFVVLPLLFQVKLVDTGDIMGDIINLLPGDNLSFPSFLLVIMDETFVRFLLDFTKFDPSR